MVLELIDSPKPSVGVNELSKRIQMTDASTGPGVVLGVVSSTVALGVGLLHRFGVGGVVCQCPGLEYVYG